MNKLVSVIVPVYNAEKYLDKTIDSILSQIYTNLEVILFDDGSKDKSLEICNNYKEKDNRVKVFHKENGGVSSARNLGLDNAKGDYVCFCDSDDIFEKNMVETLVEIIQREKVSMVMCGIALFPKGKKKTRLTTHEGKVLDIEESEDLEEALFSPIFNFSSVANKIFLREHIDSIRFIEGIDWGEDQIFVQEFLLKHPKLYVIDENLYNYHMENSTLSVRLLQNHIFNFTRLNSYRNKFLNNLKSTTKRIKNLFN